MRGVRLAWLDASLPAFGSAVLSVLDLAIIHITVLCELLNAQQTRLPTPKPQVGTRGFAQGEAPTQQREGRQMVAAARRGNGDLVLRKTVHQ